jgi:hypothetical protein
MRLTDGSPRQPTTGIEPATFCLRSRRSTAKLHWRVVENVTAYKCKHSEFSVSDWEGRSNYLLIGKKGVRITR